MIIGVCGFAGSGKDTLADHLVKNHGFNKIGFAYILKRAAQLIWNFSDEQLFGPSSMREEEDKRYRFSGTCPHCFRACTDLTNLVFEGNPRPEVKENAWACMTCDAFYKEFVTPRLALQILGTEYGRTLYQNIWVGTCLNHIREKIDEGEKDWVISDARFQNEIDGIHDVGGLVVRLLRGEQRFSHASEAELAGIDLSIFDKVLNNDRTLEDFYREIDEALPQLRYLANSE